MGKGSGRTLPALFLVVILVVACCIFSHVTIYNIVYIYYIYNTLYYLYYYSYIVYNVTIVLNVTVVIVTFNTMLHSIQCYEIICNYYTMYRTLYYTYGQGSLLLGISTLRGIGHSRQGCIKNTHRLSAAVCPSRSYNLRDPSAGLYFVSSIK